MLYRLSRVLWKRRGEKRMKTFLTVCTSGSVCALIQQTSLLPDRPKHLMSPLASCSNSCPLFRTKAPPQQKPFCQNCTDTGSVVQNQRRVPSTLGCYCPLQRGWFWLPWILGELKSLTFKRSAKRVTIMLKLANKKKRKSLLNMKYLHQSTDDGFGWNPVNNHTVYTHYILR